MAFLLDVLEGTGSSLFWLYDTMTGANKAKKGPRLARAAVSMVPSPFFFKLSGSPRISSTRLCSTWCTHTLGIRILPRLRAEDLPF